MTAVSLWGAIRRGYFPHQMSWLLDFWGRRLFITPETLADRLPLELDSRVLEVGPGSGYFSVELARRLPHGRLDLFDLQPEMLAKAVAKFGHPAPANLRCTVGDAGASLPYEDGAFDVVLLVTVLGEIVGKARALEAFRRVLSHGGTLAIHEHQPDPDFIPFRKLRPLVESQGFVFRQSWGRRWNYTATFAKTRSADS